MIKVIPLTKFDIDWNSFLTVYKQALERNVTTVLDNKGAKIGNLGSFIEIFGSIKPSPILKHLHYSFILISDDRYTQEDLQVNVLSVEANNGLWVSLLSGTLDQWQTAVINGCSDSVDTKTRYILDECLLTFDKEGLSKLWSDYRRVKAKDSTIKLIEKQ